MVLVAELPAIVWVGLTLRLYPSISVDDFGGTGSIEWDGTDAHPRGDKSSSISSALNPLIAHRLDLRLHPGIGMNGFWRSRDRLSFRLILDLFRHIEKLGFRK